MFDTREEANQKLSGSIVLFNDSPVWILEAVGKGSKLGLKYQHLRSKSERFNTFQDEGWDFKNLGSRLGYTNLDLGKGSYQEALYVSRKAVRRTQSCQGLSSHNIAYGALRGSGRIGLGAMNLAFTQLYTTPAFLDMMERKYPTLKDIRGEFDKNNYLTSRAFDPKFAVRRDDVGPYYLQYRGKDIGHTDDFSRWKIAPQYGHLKESVDTLGLRVA